MPDEVLRDPALESRARVLSQELRCVVCQNQSIDDSNAPLAHDLRVLLRDRLVSGDSDQQALDFIVARYGNFVLLKPPMQLNTLLLWIGPLLILLVAGIGFGRYVGRSGDGTRTAEAPSPLSDKERERIETHFKRTEFGMTLWFVLTVMIAIAAVLVSSPFIRRLERARLASAGELAVYRDQLKEIENEAAQGLIDNAQAESASIEIKRRMLAADRAERSVECSPQPARAEICDHGRHRNRDLRLHRPLRDCWKSRTCRRPRATGGARTLGCPASRRHRRT